MHEIARHAGHRLRRHAHEVWQSRGGGYYGFVAMLTFLYLEAVDILGDIASLRHLQLGIGGIISWLVQDAVQALMNVIRAAIWPVEWISRFGVGITSIVLLGGSYVIYRAIRPTVLRWLGEPDESPTS